MPMVVPFKLVVQDLSTPVESQAAAGPLILVPLTKGFVVKVKKLMSLLESADGLNPNVVEISPTEVVQSAAAGATPHSYRSMGLKVLVHHNKLLLVSQAPVLNFVANQHLFALSVLDAVVNTQLMVEKSALAIVTKQEPPKLEATNALVTSVPTPLSMVSGFAAEANEA
jgi:hypothetical protein